MTLWDTRTEAILYLKKDCPAKLSVLLDLFGAIDILIDCYEQNSAENTYARICGLTLLKAKNLGVGSFSLILDGLGQEAGALLRPFIEYTELLTYFRHFPDRAEDAINDKLPSAGVRAKAVNGIYKEFREHLNLHASHSSYSNYALSHLLEPNDFRFKKYQLNVPAVLDRNLRDISVQILLLLFEATRALERLNLKEFDELASRADKLNEKLFQEFELDILETK